MKKIVLRTLILAPLAAASTCALADDCSTYPYSHGMSYEPGTGAIPKIIATSSVSVAVDDIDSINFARDEATMDSKAQMVEFMEEEIYKDQSVERLVKESTNANEQGRQTDVQTEVNRVKNLRGSASGLLRGAVVLGECYTPAREMRVSVGIKEDTVQAAGGLASGISQSLSTQPSTGQGSEGGSSSGQGATDSLRSQEGYSNADRVRSF